MPVVRVIIDKHFELLASGIRCSDNQRMLFEKYEQAFYEEGKNFINFVDVGG